MKILSSNSAGNISKFTLEIEGLIDSVDGCRFLFIGVIAASV